MLVMLLCQWAVTPHRAGEHRPLIAAKMLLQRQTEILKVTQLCANFVWRILDHQQKGCI